MTSDADNSTGPDFAVRALLILLLFHAHMNFQHTMKRLDAIEAKIAPAAIEDDQ